MLHVAVCAYVPSLTHSSLQQKQGLPLLNQIISWITLGRWVWESTRFKGSLTRGDCNHIYASLMLSFKIGDLIILVLAKITHLVPDSLQALRPTKLFCLCSFLSIFYAGSVVELYTSFPSTPQHISLSHCHVPSAQHRVRQDIWSYYVSCGALSSWQSRTFIKCCVFSCPGQRPCSPLCYLGWCLCGSTLNRKLWLLRVSLEGKRYK